MSAWEIAALMREAEQTRNDWTMTDAARIDRLQQICAQIRAHGGDPAGVMPDAAPQQPAARATRSSKPAAARRKAGG